METKTKTERANAAEKKENTQETAEEFNETEELLSVVIDEIDKSYKNKRYYSGISSEIEIFDSRLQGFREGDLNIIASRPAIGKTMFALNIFTNIITQGTNALYISFDKYENELLKSILTIKTKVDNRCFDNGYLSGDDFKAILEGSARLDKNSGNIFLKTFFKIDLIELKKFIKEKIEKDKIKIVFIDYLTMITPAPTYTNRWEQVCEISRSLKSMAMEFKIPFIVLCPLHRNIVDNTPEIIDISESGSIEYEADKVILLYKKPEEKKYNDDFDDSDKDNTKITIYIAKNRRGPTATFDMLFNYKYKIITEVQKE